MKDGNLSKQAFKMRKRREKMKKLHIILIIRIKIFKDYKIALERQVGGPVWTI